MSEETVAVPDLAERAALGRRVRRTTLLTATVANLIGALVVSVYVFVLSPGDPPAEVRVWEVAVILVAYLALALPGGDLVNRRLSGDAASTLQAGETLDSRQRAALVGIPRRAALVSLGGWTLAALLFATYYALRYGDRAIDVVELGLTIVLGGLTTSALVFLLNERPLRAVYALAFREDPPTQTEGLGVRLRLVLSWGLGAGVPLLGVALAVAAAGDADSSSVRGGVITLVVIGLVAGSLVTLRAARSVAEPLSGLRAALARVRQGELDAEVPVDDVTEIGLLQAGFNEMVTGLREREQLEDLFGRHVGVEVAREALRGGIGLGGERRNMSALFVDLVGSTKLAAERPPEEVVEMLNAVFEAVVRAASREGGWVNKFEGDAALCVFGAPLDQPDHAARALRAARRLRAEVTRLARRHPRVDVGIGVSSGEAVAGNVGAEQRYEYTVIGDPVNEAARLTDEAKSRPARVLASAQAIEHGGDEAEHWREAAELRLRGRVEPTVAYEPLADETGERIEIAP